MRKLVFFIALLVSGTFLSQSFYAVPHEEISSRTAVLMDGATGQVLYDKNMHERAYPASTTKILTALLVIENVQLDEVITATESALEEITWYSTQIFLVPGERLTVEQALYALMLPSANDAANVLAEHVAGSTAAFVRMMNERAREIGALNSNFINAHGLHDDNHYTTAYDIALITRYAMQSEDFMRFFSAQSYLMPPTNLNGARIWNNPHAMLMDGFFFHTPSVTGGKTGFTIEAQNALSTTAAQDGRVLVCVVMYSYLRDQKFLDTQSLLDFGFYEFNPAIISYNDFRSHSVGIMEDGRNVGHINFEATRDFNFLLHQSVDISDIIVTFDNPEYFELDEPVFSSAVFQISGGAGYVPAYLGRIPMDYNIAIPTAHTMPLTAPESPYQSQWGQILMYGVAAAGIIFLVIFVLVARHRNKVRKHQLMRRQQRQQRLERIRRETALYTSATYRSSQQRTEGYVHTLNMPPSSGYQRATHSSTRRRESYKYSQASSGRKTR